MGISLLFYVKYAQSNNNENAHAKDTTLNMELTVKKTHIKKQIQPKLTSGSTDL